MLEIKFVCQSNFSSLFFHKFKQKDHPYFSETKLILSPSQCLINFRFDTEHFCSAHKLQIHSRKNKKLKKKELTHSIWLNLNQNERKENIKMKTTEHTITETPIFRLFYMPFMYLLFFFIHFICYVAIASDKKVIFFIYFFS